MGGPTKILLLALSQYKRYMSLLPVQSLVTVQPCPRLTSCLSWRVTKSGLASSQRFFAHREDHIFEQKICLFNCFSVCGSETKIPRERASIARRQVFVRPESFCAEIIFAANSLNFYAAFPKNFVAYLETFQIE